MRHSPLRLLVSGYGLAAVVAVLAAYAGAGFGASLLLFWLGGAASVFALALMPGVRRLFTPPVPEWPPHHRPRRRGVGYRLSMHYSSSRSVSQRMIAPFKAAYPTSDSGFLVFHMFHPNMWKWWPLFQLLTQ